jgi:two-component sensor histidine kinase
VEIKKGIMEFRLKAKAVQSVGIIINELLTNIMKYAFKGRASGIIMVSALYLNGHVEISVYDNGLGIPASVNFENSTGFGLQLVQALTQQLNGTIRIERENGTKVILEFDV